MSDMSYVTPGWPILLIVFGFILIFIGFVALVLMSLKGGVEWGGGLVIFIGPIPIVVGGGRLSKFAVLMAVLLAIAMLIALALWSKPRF